MIRPRLSKVANGTRLTTDLVNGIINRTEYAADLLRQYKLVAGKGMYVEPHYDGTRVSYLQQVGGGASSELPLGLFAGLPRDTDGAILLPPNGKIYQLPEPAKLQNGNYGPAQYIFRAAPGSSGTLTYGGGNYTVFRPDELGGMFLTPATQFIPSLENRIVTIDKSSINASWFYEYGMGLGTFNEFFPVVPGFIKYE